MLKLHISVPKPPIDLDDDVSVSFEIRYCRLEDCLRAFVPTRADQKFCCRKHRKQHHNLEAKLRMP